MNRPHPNRLFLAALAIMAGLYCMPATASQDEQARPEAGVAYAMPDGTEKFAAGTLVPYGGYNYVAQGDGTMMLAAQQPRPKARQLPPARVAAPPAEEDVVAAAPPATTTRVIYYPTATVVRTVAPNWSYSAYSFGGIGPFYGGPFVRTYGWGGWYGPRVWGPLGPFGPPGIGPYIGFW